MQSLPQQGSRRHHTQGGLDWQCIAYAKAPDEKRTKLDAKGIKCLFVGYCEGTKPYRLVFLESQKIIKSPNVVIFEDKRLLEEGPSGSIGQEALEVDHSK